MWHDSNMTCIMDIMIINPIVGNPSIGQHKLYPSPWDAMGMSSPRTAWPTDCWGTLGNK